jgi:hypothetical protein
MLEEAKEKLFNDHIQTSGNMQCLKSLKNIC